MLASWLGKVFRPTKSKTIRRGRRHKARRAPRYRPCVEILEDRLAPAGLFLAGLLELESPDGPPTNNNLFEAELVSAANFALEPPATAPSTGPTATILGNGGNNDVDFYAFIVTEPTNLMLDIDNGTFDTIVSLFDAAGNRLAFNDDGGGDPGSPSGVDSFLAVAIVTPGLYFVSVSQFSNFNGAEGNVDGPGDQPYELHISLAPSVLSQEVFLKGNYIEVGIHQAGSFGTESDAPLGFHPLAEFHESVPSRQLGFVVDPQRDGFDQGTPPQSGDYFVPGSPEEGWAVQWGTGASRNNASLFDNFGLMGNFEVPKTSLTNTSSGAIQSAVWVGTAVFGNQQLKITQTVYFQVNDLFFVIHVELENVGTESLANLRYMRNVDPDQEEPITSNYTTSNFVAFQPGVGGNADKALAVAQGLTHGLTLGLGTVDPRARVSVEGFSNRNPDDIFNSPVTYTRENPHVNDEAIAIAFDLGTLAPGQKTALTYAYILNEADLDAALSVLATDADGNPNQIVENAANGTTVGITALVTNLSGATFSLTNDAGGRFQIDAETGVVTVKNGALIDFETSGTGHAYNITVQAQPTEGEAVTIDFNIAVINQAPSLPSDQSGAANMVRQSDANGASVDIRALSTDPAGGAVTYRLTQDAGGAFAIDANTGAVTIADASKLAGLGTSADIQVVASDGNLDSAPATFTIQIDRVPSTTGLADVQVAEDADNTLINLFPSFQDTEGALTYIVVSNSNPGLFDSVSIGTDESPEVIAVGMVGSLSIGVGEGGLGTVDGPAPGSLLLDYAAHKHGTADIVVRATDSAGQSVETTLHVTVNAVADQPNLSVADASGNENALIPLDIQASLVDGDGSETLTILISNVPANATLTAGTNDGEGTWTLSPSQLAGLAIQVPNEGPVTLNVTARAKETSNNDTADRSLSMIVTVNNVAPVVNPVQVLVDGANPDENKHTGSANPEDGSVVLANGQGVTIGEGSTVTGFVSFSDAGPLDSHTVTVSFDGGSTSTTLEDSDEDGRYRFDHAFEVFGNYLVKAGVFDGAATSFLTFVVNVLKQQEAENVEETKIIVVEQDDDEEVVVETEVSDDQGNQAEVTFNVPPSLPGAPPAPPPTLSVASYNSDPTEPSDPGSPTPPAGSPPQNITFGPGTISDQSGTTEATPVAFFDIRVTNIAAPADPSTVTAAEVASLVVNFQFTVPRSDVTNDAGELDPDLVRVFYHDGASWHEVVSGAALDITFIGPDPANPNNVLVNAKVTFNHLSTPKIWELTGTVFTVAVPAPPAPTTTVVSTAVASLTAVPPPSSSVSFSSSTQLTLVLQVSDSSSFSSSRTQASTQSATATGVSDAPESPENARRLVDLDWVWRLLGVEEGDNQGVRPIGAFDPNENPQQPNQQQNQQQRNQQPPNQQPGADLSDAAAALLDLKSLDAFFADPANDIRLPALAALDEQGGGQADRTPNDRAVHPALAFTVGLAGVIAVHPARRSRKQLRL